MTESYRHLFIHLSVQEDRMIYEHVLKDSLIAFH